MPPDLHSLHVNTIAGWQNDDLQHLKNLKHKGNKNPQFREHVRNQKITADNADPELTQVWFKKMKKIMNQIDDNVAWVVPFTNRSFRFLDLGCCPGGFSTYIMKKNKQSTSVGISLDPAHGGHPYLLAEDLRPRQTIIFANMTTFQLGVHDVYPYIANTHMQPLPAILLVRDFDLVLLDAHHLRSQLASEADLLAISQILIALLSIKFGGTIVMKLSSPDSQYTATMLFMLDMLSSSLQVHKPYAMHRTQSTFYAIARGVGGKPDRRFNLQTEVIPGLKRLWEELRMGNSHVGEARRLIQGDLDFIVNQKDLEGYGERLHELCEKVWKLQADALEKKLREMNVGV